MRDGNWPFVFRTETGFCCLVEDRDTGFSVQVGHEV